MTVQDKTVYERVQYVYCRNGNMFMNCRAQKAATKTIPDAWICLQKAEILKDRTRSNFSDIEIRCSNDLIFFEKRVGESIVGVATEVFEPGAFELWFLKTILDNGDLSFSERAPGKFKDLAVDFTKIFETTIRNSARVDRWEEGREAFIENVQFFTSRQLPIEAVLPAFPCKTQNRDKAQEGKPDMGEELALQRIIDFVQAVNSVYAPGMKFYIVSDGHVFSDCIGVDDNVVDTYTAQLIQMYERMKPAGFDGICFKGLNDCFKSTSKDIINAVLKDIDIDHHLETMVDEETDLNRKILMFGCDDNDNLLREQIKTPGHSRLFLYRGFNKFMSEDLSQTDAAQKLSGKKFKKLISLVSYEMIRRNDAYSNLVELVFPFHLRFSIHAHPNSGPKFGIRLLDPEICTTGCHNQDEEDRLLHIPTPWHNAVFKVSDAPKLIVSPAKLSQEYDNDETYTGGWDHKQRCFVYTRKI
ncbi:Pyoverdine/dityrosine biosynthesis protein Dit1 [Metschnikowia aff. pulcherrima]|uniref:Pyoverdine/dityrosine biosynthesis protein Dit1 n=1 Tax=Metschnikowia aff. pulcherrima TaxID=2163413 RepID=A0A4P6XRS5_9ASCO|nr:Pyoverdine/dityrosine biosynthesis protein Dit1 [Metschnikowia aff. pulcherrima]